MSQGLDSWDADWRFGTLGSGGPASFSQDLERPVGDDGSAQDLGYGAAIWGVSPVLGGCLGRGAVFLPGWGAGLGSRRCGIFRTHW